MAVGDVAVLRVVGRYQLQNIVNTFHYSIIQQAGPEVTQWQALADDWLSANGNIWLARHVDTYSLVGIKVFTTKGIPRPPGFAALDAAGTVVGISNDALVCRTITLYTDAGNHRIRGRLQLSGGTTSMFDPDTGEVTQSEIDDLDILGAQLLQLITESTTDFQMVLWNKLLLGVNEIVLAKGRVTPSVVRSRRPRQFKIG